jgi:ubiquinone/menaquinone biosynthesis C-methylase UbiE
VRGSPTVAPAIDSQVSRPASVPSRVSVDEGYARWAASYDQTPNPLLALEERYLLPLFPNIAGKRVLDLACGTGRWLEKLSIAGPVLGVGIDLSPAMLDVAREKSAIRARLAQADCLNLPFKDSVFDLAICSFALEHMGDLNRFAIETCRVLQESADLAGWRTGFRDQEGAVQIESTSHSEAELVALFNGAGFSLVQALECFVGEPERSIFALAGKERFFDAARMVPAITVLHFRRDMLRAGC